MPNDRRLRISVSMLDAVWKYDGTARSAERLRATFLRQSVYTPTTQMEFGTAFEEVLMRPTDYEYRPLGRVQGYCNGAFVFRPDEVRNPRRLLIEWGPHVWQLPHVYPLELGNIGVNISMRADVVYDDSVVDIKCTSLPREMWTRQAEYRHQHIAYLLGYDVPLFRYLVFEFACKGKRCHLTGGMYYIEHQHPGKAEAENYLLESVQRVVRLAREMGVLEDMAWEEPVE